MKTIVITGGAGFLGRHICAKMLNENNIVYCVDNLITGKMENIKDFFTYSNFHFIKLDITSGLINLIDKGELPNEIYCIYHLACIASPPHYKKYALQTLSTNFDGTRNVLELAKLTNAKVLFSSTSEVYGDPLVHPQNEEYYGNVNTLGERSCYDEGKRVAETLIYEYKRAYKIDVKIARIFNTYGPYMDINDGRVITNFIKQINCKEPLEIYGDGNQTRSFCYVDDLINGLILLMESKEEGPINIGNPNCEFTLNNLVAEFQKLVNFQLEIKYTEATQNDPQQRKPDITKAKNKLFWEPKINLEDGIKKTMAYFYS